MFAAEVQVGLQSRKKLSLDEAMITRAVIEILNIQSMEIKFGMWVKNNMGMII